MKVIITTESASDLAPDLLEKYNVATVPIYINIGEKSYRDGIDIDSYKLFEELVKPDSKAKTSGASEHDYRTLFSSLVGKGYQIVHISVSSLTSVSYSNALKVSNEFPNVYVFDSMNASAGMGLLVLKACELADQGLSASEIFDQLIHYRDLVETSCILDTLSYVRKGGRISAVSALGAELLNLKPMVWIREGKLSLGKKYRGKLEKVIKQYIIDRLRDRNDIDLKRVFIIHTLINKSILESVRNLVKSFQPFNEIITSEAGCGISCHAGPNVLGIVFMRKLI